MDGCQAKCTGFDPRSRKGIFTEVQKLLGLDLGFETQKIKLQFQLAVLSFIVIFI